MYVYKQIIKRWLVVWNTENNQIKPLRPGFGNERFSVVKNLCSIISSSSILKYCLTMYHFNWIIGNIINLGNNNFFLKHIPSGQMWPWGHSMTLKTSPLRPIRAGARNYAWTKSIRHTYPTSFFDIPVFVIDQALVPIYVLNLLVITKIVPLRQMSQFVRFKALDCGICRPVCREINFSR